MSDSFRIIQGDALDKLRELPSDSVHCVVTSPPYWGLRDYGVPCQLGLEPSYHEYLVKMTEVFREVRRVLREDGVAWINMGDSYATGAGKVGDSPGGGLQGESWKDKGAITSPNRMPQDGLKPKDLVGMPWRLAFALQADGWWLRSDIIWHKPNPMPESVTDRPTKSHEYVFLMTKAERYYYDQEAVREAHNTELHAPGNKNKRFDGGAHWAEERMDKIWGNPAGRNLRTVWTIPTYAFTDTSKISRLVRVERDAVCGGMTHRVFPNCPIHGSLVRSDPKAACGGRGVGDPIHIDSTDNHLSAERIPDCAPIEKIASEESRQRNSDCSHLACAHSAKDHNSGSRKTAHVLETNPSYTSFSQTELRIDGISTAPEIDAQTSRKHGCNISVGSGEDVQGSSASGRTVDRIVNTSTLPIPPKCICEFYRNITEETSHFATFPPKLVEPCIKAGTSEHGCCPKCGAPWERQVELTQEYAELLDSGKAWRTNEGKPDNYTNRQPKDHPSQVPPKNETIGWSPTCTCPAADPVPCTVLDPFSGSGTVGIVALQYGRKYIGIELNPKYIEMSEKRLGKGVQKRFAWL